MLIDSPASKPATAPAALFVTPAQGHAAAASSTGTEPPAGAGATADGDDRLADIVGGNLRRIRRQQGLSLAALAQRSGVSRAMLGQVELGRSMPSIAVLVKVAQSLDLPVTAFLRRGGDDSVTLIRVGESKSLVSHHGHFRARYLFPMLTPGGAEFYEVRLDHLGNEQVAPYPAGTRVNLVVTRGSVEISVDRQRYALATGDAIRFDADVEHGYRNLNETDAIMYLVVLRPGAAADLPTD